MLSFEINGVALPLVERKIGIRLINPLFLTDVVPGVQSFPFNIVRTAVTAAALAHPELLTRAEAFNRKIDGPQIYFNGTLLFSGFLRVLGTAKERYRVVFYSGTANLKDFTDDSLQSLTLGGVRPILTDLQLLADANKDLTIDEVDFQFPPFRNPALYDDADPFLESSAAVNREYFNYYDKLIFGVPGYSLGILANPGGTAPEPKYINSYVPWAYFGYVFKRVFTENGISIGGRFLNDEWIKKLLIYNPCPLDAPGPNTSSDRHPYYPASINLQNHVPDISIGDFLKYARRTFNLCFDFSLNKAHINIDSFENLSAKKPDKDWTLKKRVSYSIDFNQEDPGYEFTIPYDSNDSQPVLNADLHKIYINGGGSQVEISKLLSVIYELDELSDVSIPTGPRNWGIPHVNQKGCSLAYNFTNPFDLRLAFYTGLYVDSNGHTFPNANDRNVDETTPAILPGGFSMRWAEPMYEKFWAKWVAMMDNPQEPTINYIWSLEDLLNFSFHDKIHDHDQDYFVVQADLEIGDVISPVKTQLKRI